MMRLERVKYVRVGDWIYHEGSLRKIIDTGRMYGKAALILSGLSRPVMFKPMDVVRVGTEPESVQFS